MIWEYQDTSSGKVIWSATAANYRSSDMAVIWQWYVCKHVCIIASIQWFWYMGGFNVITWTLHSLNKTCPMSLSMQTFLWCAFQSAPKMMFLSPKNSGWPIYETKLSFLDRYFQAFAQAVIEVTFGPPTTGSPNRKNRVNSYLLDLFF